MRKAKSSSVFRTGPAQAIEKQAAGAFAQALTEKRPVMSDLLAGESGLPGRVYVITPLADVSRNAGIPFGTVVLACDFRQYLYPLIQSWPVTSESAETILVRRDGDSVLYLSELRYAKDAAFNKRIALTQTESPAVMAVLGRKGTVEGVDYRGSEIFAALQPIPQTPWFLIAKQDRSEALSEWHSLSLLIIGLTLSLFLAASAIAWAVWQQGMKSSYKLRLEIEEAKRESEERYRITLMSIGDGVIVTDGYGNVTLLNPVAENLTGWKQDEACGKPVEEVFNAYDEQTHPPEDC